MVGDDAITVVKAALKTWIESAEFTALMLEVSTRTGGALAGPAIVYAYDRWTVPELFPAAELLGISSVPRAPDSSAKFYDHTVDVLWTATGDDEATIVRHVEALVTATRELTFRKHLKLLNGVDAPLQPGPEDYGPLMSVAGATQPLVKAGRIRVVIPTVT